MEAIFFSLVAVISYLIGSVSFARLMTRSWYGRDVTQFEIPIQGTEERYKVLNVGGNAVSIVLGPKAGLAVSLLDILKIFLPTLFCRLFFSSQPAYMVLAALGGLIGHVWPIYYRFHGGSGVSAILGGLLAIDPLALIASNVVGLLLGMVVFRNLIVATCAWIWLLIPWFWWRTNGTPTYVIYAVIVNVLFILAMIPDIKLAMKSRRQGNVMGYGIGYLSSNPMGRGMLKMARAMGFMKDESQKD